MKIFEKVLIYILALNHSNNLIRGLIILDSRVILQYHNDIRQDRTIVTMMVLPALCGGMDNPGRKRSLINSAGSDGSAGNRGNDSMAE